jgi:hypothetical protein
MFVTYAPEDPADGDRQEWTFNPRRVRGTEGQVLLRQFGEKSWDVFVQGVRQNDLHARRVLLWHLLRREHPTLKFDLTPDFFPDELTVEFSSDELAELRDIAASSTMPPETKEQILARFDREMEVAAKREAQGADLGGKALSPTSGTESTTTG